MRTVNQDDYLLARGANPRTGIITPGHSLQNSIDDQEKWQARAAAGESKWRQKGDQWISLGFDQPTPTGSPPKPDLETPLQHQIPRKPVGSPSRKRDSDRERSSSAPTPRNFKYYQPREVGNGLQNTPQKPFPGHLRASEVVSVPNTGLRCPPMNSIQSLSPLSDQVRLRTAYPNNLPNNMLTQSGGGDPSYPNLRYQKPQIPPRRYHLVQDLQVSQKTRRPCRPLRHEIQVVHPRFQPHSLRGKMLDLKDIVMREGGYQRCATQDIFTTIPNTISTNTDTRIPFSTCNGRFQCEPKPHENVLPPRNRTRMWGDQRPPMPDRSDEMTDVPRLTQQARDCNLSSMTHMGDGATAGEDTHFQQSNPTGTGERVTEPKYTSESVNPNNMSCYMGSFEHQRCNIPGSIPTSDGPAEAEVDTDDGTTPSIIPTASNSSERAITTTTRAVRYGDCIVGLNGSGVTCLEPPLVAFIGRLLDMGSYSLQTLGKVLRMSYIYSETGTVKMDGRLTLEVVRSTIYALILGAIALALARVGGLVVKAGMNVLWVLKGVFWVLT